MRGLMQEQPLLVSTLIEHAEANHPRREIVSRSAEGLVRTSYGEVAQRARRMVTVLRRLGVEPGDRVATLAWNDHRHMELYFAVSGMGAVLHTVNPRLFAEQIEYIVNHARTSTCSLRRLRPAAGQPGAAPAGGARLHRHVPARTDARGRPAAHDVL
jgi:acyl-CoA synthetase (AMP-forming)/AMP-acid ligase II